MSGVGDNLGKFLHSQKAAPQDGEPTVDAAAPNEKGDGVGDAWKRLQASAKKKTPRAPGDPTLSEPPKNFPAGKVRG